MVSRMAGLLACGSMHHVAFPVKPVAFDRRYPLTVAGAAVDSGPDLGLLHHIPNCSHHAWHESREPCRPIWQVKPVRVKMDNDATIAYCGHSRNISRFVAKRVDAYC